MLADKLQEFYDALVAVKTALIAKDVVVSKFTLDLIAGLVGQIQTQRDMGTQEVTFEQNAIILGVKVEQAERDPDKRVQPTDDLVGHVRVTVDQSSGTVDYGTIQDTFLFKALNHIVLKSVDQTEEIELDPNDYSKKIDGSIAPVAERYNNYNAFARADKVYIYQYNLNGYEYFKISDVKVDDNFEPIGFYTETGESDSVYLASFLGSRDGQDRLASKSGVRISNEIGFTDSYNDARKNGSDYYLETYAHINLYQLAFLIMFQNDSCYKALGAGRSIVDTYSTFSDHQAESTTGFANNKGSIAYDTKTRAIKFMHVEDLWFYSGESWVEGICFQNTKTYVKMRPPYPIKDEQGDRNSYTEVTEALTSYGYVKSSVVNNKWGRIPNELTGDNDYYQCDDWSPGSGSTLMVPYHGRLSGICNYQGQKFTASNLDLTARLSLIPSN